MRGFRKRLVIGYVLLLVVMLSLGTTALIGLRLSTTRLEETTRTLTEDLVVIERLRFRAEHVVAVSRGYLLMPSSEQRLRFEEAIAQVREHFERDDRSRLTPQRAASQIPVELAVRHYVALARRAVERRIATEHGESLVPFLEKILQPARERLEQVIGDFVENGRLGFEDASDEAEEFASRIQRLVLLATAFCVALALGVAGASMRRLNAMFASEHEATAEARRAVLSRDEVMAIVSHDLRSPLQTIGLAVGTLRDGAIDPTTLHGIRAIERARERMESLITQLLELGNVDRGTLALDRTRCTVRDLVDTVASEIELRARAAKIELVVSPAPEQEIEIDRERILQVLSNVLDNALKHTPTGGRIEIRTSVGERVRFEVVDSGPGIPPEQLPHVFLRYWRGSRTGRGSLGLGLYICKQVVMAHEGEIGVDSEVGRGTTFWFELPRAVRR